MVSVGSLALLAGVAVMYAFSVEEEGMIAGWALGREPNLVLLNVQNLFS